MLWIGEAFLHGTLMSNYGGNMKFQITVWFALLLSAPSFAKVAAVVGNVPLADNPNVAIMPNLENEDEIIVSRRQYLISYNKKRRSPNWVSWKLESSDIGSVERTNVFIPDSDLQKYLQDNNSTDTVVKASEFTNTCFDRGHQVPSKDRSDSEQNNEETFITSNIVPQTSFLNRVIWNQLEDYSRRLLQQGKNLYIIAGPIYDEDFGWIGPQKNIPVPSKNFKIIFVLDKNQGPNDINRNTETISVIMPNVLSNGQKPTNGNACEMQRLDALKLVPQFPWEKYKVSVDDVQKVSGIHLPF